MESSPKSPERSPYRTRALLTALGITSVGLVVGGCLQATQPEPTPYLQPSHATYFLDTANPYYDRVRTIRDEASDPAEIAALDQLLQTPIARWLNGDERYSRQLISENLADADRVEQLPAFVFYNIPQRDLGGEAKGGFESASEYRQWKKHQRNQQTQCRIRQ